MHSLGIVQWNSTRRDHPGNPGRVSGSGPVIFILGGTNSRHKHLELIVLTEPVRLTVFCFLK